MSEPPTLAQRMVARADADGLLPNHDLRDLAEKLEEATTGFFGATQTHTVKQFMGCYARARVAWCNYSGEPLV